MAHDHGVLFDLDGVLLDSAGFHLDAWQALGEEIGHPVSEAFFRATFGQTNGSILPRLLGRDLAEPELAALGERKEELFRAAAGGRIALYAGVEQLLRELRAHGFGLALATSTPRSNLEFYRRELALDALLDVFVCAADVRRGKPDPEVFVVAAERLGLPPERCAVVEDAPAGIAAGLAGGMRVVGVATTHPAAALREEGGHLVVERTIDLTPTVLESLLG